MDEWMNKKGPFESRRMFWVVADTTGARDPELASERMGSSMKKWNHFLYTRAETSGAQGGNC